MGGTDRPPSVTNTVEGSVDGVSIQLGSVAGDLTVLFDQPNYRLELRAPGTRPRRRRKPRPSYLLDAQWEIVPFRPREVEERRLREWRDGPAELSVLLLHGPGGHGKTRLAGRFAAESHRREWTVAQAVDKRPDAPRMVATAPVDDAELVVLVDYADRWPRDLLVELIEWIAGRRTGARTRVLLLARSAGALWQDVTNRLDPVADFAKPVEMGRFATDDQPAAFADAVAAFQSELGLDAAPLELTEELLSGDFSPLGLHMAALASVCAREDHIPTPRDLSTYLLRRERRLWRSEDTGWLDRAALIATLFGPVAEPAAARALLRTGLVADGDADADRLVRAYQEAYPGGEHEVLTPVRPDRFGEDLVAELLTDDNNVDMLRRLVAEAGPWERRQCMAVMMGASQRHEHAASLVEILTWDVGPGPAIAADPDAYLDLWTDHWLADHVPSPPADLPDDERAQTYLVYAQASWPDTPDRLRPTWRRIFVTQAVQICQRLVEEDPRTALPLLGRALNQLGTQHWLDPQNGLVSRPADKAVEAATRAVQILRRLAESDPDRYLGDAATVLANLVRYLREADPAAATARTEELAELLRRLAGREVAPDAAVDVAAQCIGLVDELRDAGDNSMESLMLRDDLLHAAPDARALALSTALAQLGQRAAEADRTGGAVDLTRGRLDLLCRHGSAFDVASALMDLARYSGDVAPLAEAVGTARAAAEADLGKYWPELARTLSDAAMISTELGDHGGALELLNEHVALLREWTDTGAVDEVAQEVARLRDQGDVPELAATLATLSGLASASGDLPRALAASEEAVRLLRGLAREDPGQYVPYLIQATQSQSWLRAATGDVQGAVRAARAATGNARKLVRAGAEYLPILGQALIQLAAVAQQNERHRTAAAAAVEAQSIWHDLAATDPNAELMYAAALSAFAASQAASQEDVDAGLSAARTAEEILARLDHPSYEPALRDVRSTLATLTTLTDG
jgi:hypothetical protein